MQGRWRKKPTEAILGLQLYILTPAESAIHRSDFVPYNLAFLGQAVNLGFGLVRRQTLGQTPVFQGLEFRRHVRDADVDHFRQLSRRAGPVAFRNRFEMHHGSKKKRLLWSWRGAGR